MVVSGPQRRLETIGISGFGKQFLSLLGVVRPRTKLDGIVDALRQRAFRGEGVTAESHLGEGFLIDGIVDGLTHAEVVERLLEHIHVQVARHDGRRGDQLEVLVLFQNSGLFIRHREGEVGFAGTHHRGTGVVVHNGHPGDGIDLGQAGAPVVLVLHTLKIVGLLPFHELVRTGAHGVEHDVLTVLLERGGGNHDCGGVRELVDEGREGRLQGHLGGEVVDHFGLGDVGIQAVALQLVFRVGNAVEVDLDGFGVEVCAVVEFHTFAQVEGVHEPVGGHVVTFGEHGTQFKLLVEAEQPFIEGFRTSVGQRIVGIPRVGGGQGRGDGKHYVLGRMGLRSAQRHNHRRGNKHFFPCVTEKHTYSSLMRLKGGLMTTPCAIAERRTILNVLNELSAFAPAGSKNALYAAKLAMKTESRRKTSLGEALLKREALDDPKTSSPPALQIRNGQGSLL